MIEAADHGRDPESCPAPFELDLARQMRQWRTLPEAGGLLDQRPRLMRTLAAAHNAWLAAREYRRAPAGARALWRNEHPDLDEVLAAVERMRAEQ